MHSYFRNKILYCYYNRKSNLSMDLQSVQVELSRSNYFYFAPTLIYRDSYPLAKTRNLVALMLHFFNFLLCVYFGFILFNIFCKD